MSPSELAASSGVRYPVADSAVAVFCPYARATRMTFSAARWPFASWRLSVEVVMPARAATARSVSPPVSS